MNDKEHSGEISQIGETAGMIWQQLDQNGPTRMPDLIKGIDAPRDRVMQAIGWLAREHKIAINTHSRTRVVELINETQ